MTPMPLSATKKSSRRLQRATTSMTTLFLLAGRSTRFWPLREKALWPFLDKPLLLHQLERLQAAGLGNVTLVGGAHNLAAVRAIVPHLETIEQEDLMLGMRGALLSALPHVAEGAVCIVSSNDVIESSGYAALLEAMESTTADGALLAQRVKSYFPGGYLTVRDGRVTGIAEKPSPGQEPSDLVNIVAHIHRHPRLLLEKLQSIASQRDNAYEVALAELCRTHTYLAVPYLDAWHAVKYPWHILALTERFLSSIAASSLHPTAVVHPQACVEGNVVLEEGVQILPFATVKGPCYIGHHSVIGTTCLVRSSIVGERCVIGFGSEITRSCLHSSVWTHSTYLGDSVVGANVAFGAGTITANFRLDEGFISSNIRGEPLDTHVKKLGAIIGANTRIGVGVRFAPGVKVGEGSFVNTATTVDRDVPERSFVKMGISGMDTRENRTGCPPPRR